MHPPPPYDPAVTVSALALQNLSNLPFARYLLTNPPPTNPVAKRARWLEPGVSQSLALPAAALSLLSDHLPSALAAILRPSPKSPKPPALYVFGTRATLAAASDLLHDAFSQDQVQLWTPQSPAVVTRALTTAIHRAIVHALESSGAIRVASDLILPDTNLSYSFTVSLGRGNNPDMLIRVAVKHTPARRITDQDCAFALQAPLTVFAAPLGLSATLSPRPVAGDALTASVLKRWREAGLLPATELSDSTVVFLTINGVDVPFPRVAVLTNESTNPTQSPKPLDKPTPQKPSPAHTSLWRSRKRPRSPLAAEDASFDNAPSKTETQPAPDPVLGNISPDAPTAASLNAALQAHHPKEDTAPILHHPLVEPIQPPTCENIKSEITQEKPAKVDKEEPTLNEPSKPVKDQVTDAPQPPAETADPIKSEPVNEAAQSRNGIDTFLLDGDGNTQDGFDTGPGMDMTDFADFEDDVTEFFRDGMDERLGDVDNDSALFDAEGTGRGTAQANQNTARTKNGGAEYPSGDQDATKVSDDMKMDVDVKPGSGSPDQDVNASANGATSSLTALEIVHVALSTLRRPIPSTRPKRDTVKTQLSSFFEEDLTERRYQRLGATRTIKKRKNRSKSLGKITPIELQAIQTRLVDQRAFAYESAPPSELENSAAGHSTTHRGSPYVPRRKVKAYAKLRQRGLPVNSSASLAEDSDSESSVSDEEEGNTSDIPTGKRVPRTADELLSLDTPSQVSSRSTKSSPKPSAQNGHKDDLDFLKVADAVAIDCASACMVLAAGNDSNSPNAGLVGHAFVSTCSQEGSGSPSTTREEEPKSGLPIGLPQNASKIIPQHSYSKLPPATGNGSPLNRQAGKRDREMFALLSLLEMQLFSSNELSIFADGDDIDSVTASTRKAKNTSDSERDHVSSATMRRVLLGLPRALETSSSLSSCIASFRVEGEDTPVPTVKGPLSVNDFLGGQSTVFPLSSPRVCVGFNTEWMEASSGALPLWEKAGFEPYSEKKNVEYVAVAPKDLDEDVKLFLRDVSAAYEECSFGKHAAMPTDPVTLISHSVPKGSGNDRGKNPGALSAIERAMTEQYHLAVTGLCTKLAAITRDNRKNPSGSPRNIVAYVISPFAKTAKAANVSLIRAVAPLVSTVPGTVPSMVGTVAPGPNLPPAPWRSSPASKSVVSVTVRVIPREVVDRKLSGRADLSTLLQRPLRPQLMKAVSFAVFNSIRFKRVRVPSVDGEVSSLLSRASLIPDELMSPMTPDFVGETPSGNATPVSPIGPTSEDSGHGSVSTGHNGSLLDQSSALSPSFLHEPVVVLAGVGKHMDQTECRPNIVLHLAYAFCESSSRYVFAWTDQRGEILDTATVPVSKAALSSSRKKAFWGMWARGQRWRISYVDEVHVTVAKLGAMAPGEIEDWDWVINKVTTPPAGLAEKKGETTLGKLTRRFPPRPTMRGEGICDAYTDVPTPATHSLPTPGGSGNDSKNAISMDIKMPSIASVSILNACSAESHLFMEKSGDGKKDRRDFAVVSDTSALKGNVQANAILARFEDDGITAIEMNVIRHYGNAEEAEEMSDDRSPWDSFNVQVIANTIAVNFHELRYVASPPSWPHRRWLSLYPIHLDAVRGFNANLKHVQNFAFMTQTSGAR